jgi:hypothetical protein
MRACRHRAWPSSRVPSRPARRRCCLTPASTGKGHMYRTHGSKRLLPGAIRREKFTPRKPHAMSRWCAAPAIPPLRRAALGVQQARLPQQKGGREGPPDLCLNAMCRRRRATPSVNRVRGEPDLSPVECQYHIRSCASIGRSPAGTPGTGPPSGPCPPGLAQADAPRTTGVLAPHRLNHPRCTPPVASSLRRGDGMAPEFRLVAGG